MKNLLNLKTKTFIKYFIPPVIINVIKSLYPKTDNDDLTWKGNYQQWTEAKENCTGYSSQNILEACRQSLLKVKNGEAVYERDSVLFDEKEYSWPLLAAIQHVTLMNNGMLNILDFGGSLGSSYYQNRDFLRPLKNLTWTIVEQANFVKCGKAEFENEELNFEYTIEDAVEKRKYNCLLLSNVLQYLEDPYSSIKTFLNFEFDFIIIDLLTCAVKHQLTVQNVPAWIYKASYPCHFLDDKDLLQELTNRYEIISTYTPYPGFKFTLEDNNTGFFKGFFLKKKGLIYKKTM